MVSDLLPRLVLPLGLALQLLVLCMVLWSRHRRFAKTAGVTAFVILWVFSLPRVSHALIASLEQRYPSVGAADAPCADAIVLLGGGLQLPYPPRTDVQLGPGADRLLATVRLWKAGKAPVVLLSTGGGIDSVLSETDQSARLLNEWGIPEDVLVYERTSTNTDENAQETALILQQNEINTVLLVTSASHMTRAMALFRAEGIAALPFPADHWVVDRSGFDLREWIPDAINLSGSSRALREYLGMAHYLITGRISLDDLSGALAGEMAAHDPPTRQCEKLTVAPLKR